MDDARLLLKTLPFDGGVEEGTRSKTGNAGVGRARDRAAKGLGVRVEGLVKRFGEREILHELNLEITPGEFVSIVGRSGCGKSTFLRLLAGLEEISSGLVDFSASSAKGRREDVRIMFQDPRLLPWRTVIENIAIGLSGKRKEIDRQAREVLKQVGLADRADDWPGQLSGGQRQRVALARALIHRPRLLLLDEPLGALDALTRLEMQRLIENIWRRHEFTAILVTHDVTEATILGDRVLLIEDGRVTFDEKVGLARPREYGQPGLAALGSRVLGRIMSVASIEARNQIRGRIVDIHVGKPLSEVSVETRGGIIAVAISSRSLSEQPFELGTEVLAFFKSNEVILATDAN
ncbi:MAG: ATP-binding cassette domain-containing protein [Candidatus Accumulibacter sp.]|jgi:sulfonate transport system ATP-binding protein|nr:ATP-binding cassette domain-containing protein [Accumulibacter sp.]